MRISCEPADSRVEAVGGLLRTVYTTCFLRTIGFPCRMPSPSRRPSPPLPAAKSGGGFNTLVQTAANLYDVLFRRIPRYYAVMTVQ